MSNQPFVSISQVNDFQTVNNSYTHESDDPGNDTQVDAYRVIKLF